MAQYGPMVSRMRFVRSLSCISMRRASGGMLMWSATKKSVQRRDWVFAIRSMAESLSSSIAAKHSFHAFNEENLKWRHQRWGTGAVENFG